MSSQKSNIWYVPHPTFVFNEDVKALARQHGLRIVDAEFDAGDGVKDAPALTLKGDEKQKRKSAQKADDQAG